MSGWGTPDYVERPRLFDHQLWLIAIIFFGIGDLATTSIGLSFETIAEVGPFTAPLIRHYGLGGMVGLKLAVFCGLYLIWKLVPRPHNLGVPLGLAILGIAVTGWNLQMVIYAIIAQ